MAGTSQIRLRLSRIIRRDRWAPSGKKDGARLLPFAEYARRDVLRRGMTCEA